jgi:putative ABC transport system substrate-binding protein
LTGPTVDPIQSLRNAMASEGDQMNRRNTLFALASLGVAPIVSFGQKPGKVWHVGILLGESAAAQGAFATNFQKGMANLGYVEGRNVSYEIRYGASGTSLEEHARELVARNVDLIWTTGKAYAEVAQKATSSIPIVFSIVPDPVHAGLVRSLAAPGRNATGMSLMSPELSSKLMEILNEIFPKIRRVGVLHDSNDSASTSQLPFAHKAAAALGIEPLIVDVRAREDVGSAFQKLKQIQAQALLILTSTLFFTQRKAILEAASAIRLPTFGPSIYYANVGGIASYGADYDDNVRRSASYVDKIFKGAKPADLPVEQPTKFELVINMKTAQTLRVTIPPSLLLRADQVLK